MDQNKVKDNIKTLREKRKLTQLQLAELLVVDRTTVAKWESGETLPKTSMLPKLVECLKCKLNDLFKE